MFKMPSLLAYAKILDIADRPELNGIFSYIIYRYKPGASVLIKLQNGESGIVVGDWMGRSSGPDNSVKAILGERCLMLIRMMKSIRIDQAQYYFAEDGSLVDVQLSLNKFIGPGMLRDLFSKLMATQKIVETAVLTPDKIQEIRSDKSKYPESCVLKPSRFRYVGTTPTSIVPCYATIG